MSGRTISAFSSHKAESGRIPVFTAAVNSPAALPARTPSGAFSTTIHSFFA